MQAELKDITWADSLKGLVESCTSHKCANKKMVSCDLHVPPCVAEQAHSPGYACEGCGEWFCISLPSLKKTFADAPDSVRLAFKSAEGRKLLANSFSNGPNVKLGELEGETCNRSGCLGVIEVAPVENCSCHINPPCSECVTPHEYCPECGWRAKDEN